MSQERLVPSPQPTPETEAVWAAAREGRLMIGHCASCGEKHHYPRRYCPFCGGDADLVEASGEGEIYSFSVMRRARIPYSIAYIRLQEGVTMMSGLVDCDLDSLRVGMKVRLVFKPSENGQPVPFFRPV